MIESRPVPLGVAAPKAVVTPAPASAAKNEGGPSFGEVLRAIGEEAKKGERLVDRAVHAPRDMSAGELIALQAGVYRWIEVVDLASKLVDRTTQAAKQVTQSSG